MKRSPLSAILVPSMIIIAGFAALIGLSRFIDDRRPQLPDGYGDTDLTFHGSRVKGFAFGAEGLIADWYFMRALQYIGNKILANPDMDIDLGDLRPLNPRLLYPLLQNATDLDPHFIAAYSYGAMVMPAIDSQQAIDFAKKGVANNRDSWRLHQYLGYIYWKLDRYDEAADAFEQGSKLPDAAPFMRLMAASMRTEGGSRDTARTIYRQMFEGTDDDQVRITALRRLNELDSLDERDAIDRTLAEVNEKNGRCPNDLREVTPLLAAIKLPGGREFRIDKANRVVDPTGAPYLLDRLHCRVTIDVDHTGLPLK